MQYYETQYPSENELVAIRITKVHDYGVEAILLEYADGPRGIIYNKDLSRKRIRSIKDVVQIGQETIATVIAVCPESVDLSIRHCNKDDIKSGLYKFGRHRSVHSIIKAIAMINSNDDLIKLLYNTVVWPLQRLELDVYDEFLKLHNPDHTLAIETPYIEEIRKLVKIRLPPPRVSKFRDISITYTNSLQSPDIITHLLHTIKQDYECDIIVLSPPLYRIQVNGESDEDATQQLDFIQTRIDSFVPDIPSYNPSFYTASESPLDLASIAQHQATMNLGTLGNVSEGKSTFVRALSKIATQRHQKEKRFNITINLGYAGFKIWRHIETGDLTSSSSATHTMENHELLGHYSFVDCPGHEAYLATMLSGAAIMDAAALLIASNSPSIPQIQTQEHLIAAETTGLQHIFVIQNKLDVVDSAAIKDSFEKISAFVTGTTAENSPIIPMSAQREWGIEYALHHIAYNIPPPIRTFDGPVRMQIVRSFDINRPTKWSAADSKILGGVIGGSIIRGVLHPEDLLEIRPGLFLNGEAVPILTRVSTLNCDAENLPFAIAGGLIGVGTTLDPALTSANALVGQVAGTPGTLPDITTNIKGKFKSFDRSQSAEDDSAIAYKFKKHKEGDKIRFCVGSMTVTGRISKVSEKGRRTIKLDRPVCIEVGQMCSLLRSNGSRELLDGIFTVEAVKPFKNVRPLPAEDLVSSFHSIVMSRKYNVIANDLIANPLPLPNYNCMLDAIETNMVESKPISIKLPPPTVQRLPKKTAWLNIPDILTTLKIYTPVHEDAVCIDTHFQTYLINELSTTLTVKKDGQYILSGRFTEANFRTILKKYIQKYHRCSQCGSCNTSLIRRERVSMIVCSECTSNYSILE